MRTQCFEEETDSSLPSFDAGPPANQGGRVIIFLLLAL